MEPNENAADEVDIAVTDSSRAYRTRFEAGEAIENVFVEGVELGRSQITVPFRVIDKIVDGML